VKTLALDSLYNTLRSRVPRLTKGKKAVVDCLHRSSEPLAASEIHAWIQRSDVELAAVDLATVYRNLEQLEKVELLVKVEYSASGWKYALAQANHTHSIACVQCGKHVVMNECLLADVERMIAERTGFANIHHTVNFTGCCPQCQQRSADELNTIA